MLVLRRALALALLFSASAFAGLFEITFNGTLTPGTQDLSKMVFVYEGSDGVSQYQLAVQVFPTTPSCLPSCDFQASGEQFVPDGWSPTLYSKYTVMGIYAGGGLFIVTDPSFNLAGADFDATFGASPGESQLISDANGFISWGFPGGNDAKALVANNLSFLPDIAIVLNTQVAVPSNGKIWDFTSGTQNGTLSIAASSPNVSAVPVPSTALLFFGALLLWGSQSWLRPSFRRR